jgi:hypothetical protein
VLLLEVSANEDIRGSEIAEELRKREYRLKQLKYAREVLER